MGFAEVDIVIDPCTRFVRSMYQTSHHRPYDRIDGEKRTKEHHVVLTHFGHFSVQRNRCMVLVEDILRIVVLIEERQ